MTERLSDVMARIGSVRQLSSVIGAMRGIAAARAPFRLGGAAMQRSTTLSSSSNVSCGRTRRRQKPGGISKPR